MSVKTLVINGDPDWNFRQELWKSGLDLFPIVHDVTFADTTPLMKGVPDPRPVIGHFPVDASRDPAVLYDIIDEALDELFADENARLAVLVVLSPEQIQVQPTDWLGNAPAQNPAVTAISRIIKYMDDRALDRNRVAKELGRLWLSVVIRDTGASEQDIGTMESFAQSQAGESCRINSAFGLSLLNQHTGNAKSAELHFLKVRALIDMMRAPDHAAWDLRARGGEHLVGSWIRLQNIPQWTAGGAVLAGLVRTYIQSRNSEAVGPSSSTDIAGAVIEPQTNHYLETLKEVQASAGTWVETGSAAPALKERIKLHNDEATRAERRTAAAVLDHQDIGEVMNGLAGRLMLGRFRSRRRSDKIANLEPVLQAAYDAACTDYEIAATQLLKEEVAQSHRRIKEVRQRLEQVPPVVTKLARKGRADLLKRAIGLLDSVPPDPSRQRERTVHEAILQTRTHLFKLKQRVVPDRTEIPRMFARLLQSEKQLVSFWTILAFVLFFLIVMFLPSIVNFLTLNGVSGAQFGGWGAFFAALTKSTSILVYLAFLTVGLSLSIGLAVAWRLARARDMRRKELIEHLDTASARLEILAAHRVEIAQNRSIAARWQLVRNFLSQEESDLDREDADQFMDLLGNLVGQQNMPAAVDLGDAREAFNRGIGRIERLRAFLGQGPKGMSGSVFEIMDLRRDRPLTFPCSFAQNLTIALSEVGDDRS